MTDVNVQDKIIWDAQDAVNDARAVHGDNHCARCVGELDDILQSDPDNKDLVVRELKDFAKRLQLKKMQRGCLGCHPPNYCDWDVAGQD